MSPSSDVCVLVPTLNEATTIGSVVSGLRAKGYDRILVMDGGSDDDTRRIADEHGAEVRIQDGSGKGQAVTEAVEYIEEPYVLMLDGDGTYRPADADRVLEPLVTGEADHVIGNRFHDMEAGAMTSLNQVGNRIINWLFRFINRRDLNDILSGYRAFSRESFQELDLSAEGFGIEAEMTGSAVRHGHRIEEVPIIYQRRPEASETKLNPIRDGAVILTTLYLIARMNNPLVFFGSLGLLTGAFGVGLGLYVGYRWYFVGVTHEIMAVVSSFFVLFGFLLFMFGILSDMIVRLHEEQRQRIERLREAVEGER